MKWKQLDVKTAYLNAGIDEEIFVQQPLGFEMLQDGENVVCRLKKSLYMIKPAGRTWFFTLRGFLTSIGFKEIAYF